MGKVPDTIFSSDLFVLQCFLSIGGQGLVRVAFLSRAWFLLDCAMNLFVHTAVQYYTNNNFMFMGAMVGLLWSSSSSANRLGHFLSGQTSTQK